MAVPGSRCVLVFLLLAMLVFFFFGGFYVAFGFAKDEADARLAIVAADGSVVNCYKALVEAERAGANVTVLLSNLTEAGMLWSKANLAYSLGDFDSARELAFQSEARLNGFMEGADVLKESALRDRYWDFMVNIVGSLVGVGVVIFGGFAFWHLLTRKYEKVGSAV